MSSQRLVVDVVTGDVHQRIDYDTFGRITADTNPGGDVSWDYQQPFSLLDRLTDADGDVTDFDYDAVRRGVEHHAAETDECLTKLTMGGDDLATRMLDARDREIEIWSGHRWADVLALWWCLDAVSLSGIELDNIWLVQPPVNRPPPASLDVWHKEPVQLEFSVRVRLRSSLVRAGKGLWRRFSASTPREFESARREGSTAFPALTMQAV